MGQQPASMRLLKSCAAPAEVVYDLLADLRSHLRWAGAEQSADFRLLSMDAPAGPARQGTVFTTTGSIPMSGKRWEDRSTVTEAARPDAFEFVTEARAGSMSARYRHRYDIAATPNGSTVTYTMTQEAIANPFLRLGLPVMRQMMWAVGIPMFAGRGFRNLLSVAAREAAATPALGAR